MEPITGCGSGFHKFLDFTKFLMPEMGSGKGSGNFCVILKKVK
jgi:hypothetical protein